MPIFIKDLVSSPIGNIIILILSILLNYLARVVSWIIILKYIKFNKCETTLVFKFGLEK